MKVEFNGFAIMDSDTAKKAQLLIKKVLKYAKLTDYSITISLVEKEDMLALQKNFLGKNYLTDVLSFPLPDDEKSFSHSQKLLGDIVICLDKAKEQALEFGHSLIEELIVLSTHGLFHLLGFDHERGEEEEQMQMQGEMWLLESAGFDPSLTLIGRVN